MGFCVQKGKLHPQSFINMSSSTISGTQSPQLEATGEHKPMGASSVNTVGQDIDVVPDQEQRKGM